MTTNEAHDPKAPSISQADLAAMEAELKRRIPETRETSRRLHEAQIVTQETLNLVINI